MRAQVKAGRSPGPESSIGKVHQGGLNQRMQLLAVDLLGADAMAWERRGDDASLPPEVRGMLRSRANTIEGGTTEVNKNIVGERVLGLPARARSVAARAVARDPAQLTAMAYETLRVERSGPVGWLVFDRPDAANAMDARMMAELEAAWRELADDPEVRVIVNTGEGRAFQTGVDVVQLSRDRDALREQSPPHAATSSCASPPGTTTCGSR